MRFLISIRIQKLEGESGFGTAGLEVEVVGGEDETLDACDIPDFLLEEVAGMIADAVNAARRQPVPRFWLN